MSLKKNSKKSITAALCAVGVCLVGALSYVFINSLVKYEVSPPQKDTASLTGSTEENIRAESPEDIPEAEGYTLFLENGSICVYNDRGERIYREENAAIHALSPSDIAELEQDGMKFAARSEVIEILNYLRS
ncbi:MAG: hypothetical protein ACI4RV_09795 [Eubacteriales bacterium]